jgi:hypothetical protein
VFPVILLLLLAVLVLYGRRKSVALDRPVAEKLAG